MGETVLDGWGDASCGWPAAGGSVDGRSTCSYVAIIGSIVAGPRGEPSSGSASLSMGKVGSSGKKIGC